MPGCGLIRLVLCRLRYSRQQGMRDIRLAVHTPETVVLAHSDHLRANAYVEKARDGAYALSSKFHFG